MKSKVTFAAIALCFAVSSQSFGFDLLDRMLGGSGCGCDTSCCATPEPTCGCDGIGKIRGRFFNRGCCDNGCDTGANKACDNGCDSGCGNNGCCRPRILSFDVKCLSIPVVVPKICLPKIKLPRLCMNSCCDSGCDKGCDKAAEPACGADKKEAKCGCEPKCCKPAIKLNRCGLLDRMKCRPRLLNKCGCDDGCDADKKEASCGADKKEAKCGCEPACGSDNAPKPEADKKVTSTKSVPPAPVVDPSAFGGIEATPISDVN